VKRGSFQRSCLQIDSQLKAVGEEQEGMETWRRRAPSRGHVPEAKAVLSSLESSGSREGWERQRQSLRESGLMSTTAGFWFIVNLVLEKGACQVVL